MRLEISVKAKGRQAITRRSRRSQRDAAKFLLTAALLVPALTGQDSKAETAGLKIHATQPGVAGSVCVRVIIQQSDGSYLAGEWGNPAWPPMTMRGQAMGSNTVVQVLTGLTQITIGKGPDYVPQTIVTNLALAGQVYTLDVALEPEK